MYFLLKHDYFQLWVLYKSDFQARKTIISSKFFIQQTFYRYQCESECTNTFPLRDKDNQVKITHDPFKPADFLYK